MTNQYSTRSKHLIEYIAARFERRCVTKQIINENEFETGCIIDSLKPILHIKENLALKILPGQMNKEINDTFDKKSWVKYFRLI